MTENQFAKEAVQIALTIHRTLGPGLLESVYESAFVYELRQRNIPYTRQQEIPVYYKTEHLPIGFRADLILGDKLIIEIKSVEFVLNVHKKILLTYLRLTDKKLGLLINFNEELVMNGIERVINGELEDDEAYDQ